jgi:methylglutaconyl-CoA hydratase
MSLAPEPVLLDISPEGVAVVTINRPAKKNAVDAFTLQKLKDTFETLKGADHVRIVFLRGAHEFFCAGGDIATFQDLAQRPLEDAQDYGLLTARTVKALHDLPQFTVALVEGQANGLGAAFVCASDWAVMRADAQIRVTGVRLGIAPTVVAPFLVAAVGPRTARTLIASAAPLDAQGALRIGLAQEIAETRDDLESAMKRLANHAAENAPGAVAAVKKQMQRMEGLEDSALKHAAHIFAQTLTSNEAREGLAAQSEKRSPEWKQ